MRIRLIWKTTPFPNPCKLRRLESDSFLLAWNGRKKSTSGAPSYHHMSRGHPIRPRSLIGIAVCHARYRNTERKSGQRSQPHSSNLEQTRVCFREMESLVDPLTTPRAPCLLIDEGSCFYSAALWPATTTATATANYQAIDYTALKQCLEHRL